MYIKTTTVAMLSLIMICLTGCFSSNPKNIESFTMPYNANVSCDEYILQPPDEIVIHCSKVPEIDLQTQQIRPDGKVSFESLGEIDAAGKSPKQLANTLRAKVLELYKLTGDNPIDVRITVYRSKFYYVVGQVNAAGPHVYTGRDTVLTALAQSVPTVLAWEQRVQVVRPSADKSVKPKIFEVNFDKMTFHGDTSKNVLLEEGDIIAVPPTILAGISMVMQELLAPITATFSTVNVVTGTPVRTVR